MGNAPLRSAESADPFQANAPLTQCTGLRDQSCDRDRDRMAIEHQKRHSWKFWG